MDFDVITDDVFGAMWVILPPASWCWPSPAKAIESTSPCAPSPLRRTAGYFIVSCEPRLPSTHSMVAFLSATARFVTRLETFVDQFWIVVYRQRPPSRTRISTTAECSESVV